MKLDLWQQLPNHHRRTDESGDLARFISCLQSVTDQWLESIKRWPEIFDLERASEPFLDLILKDLGNPFLFQLDLSGKRRLAAVLVEMYRQKGTAPGIANAIRFFMGHEVTVVAYADDSLVLGQSELNCDFCLGPGGRFPLYAFDVVVSRELTVEERAQLRAIVEFMKPAHTHFVNLVEPIKAPLYEHWELGISDLDENCALH